jgi:D-alanyl-D-alanine carboxypeptidase (penicillin-binding protein 5/6)
MKIKPHIHPSIAILGALCLPLGAFLIGVAWVVYQPPHASVLKLISLNADAVQAKAAVIYDPTTGQVLWQKDANEELPLASLTKLMTAQTVLSTESPQTSVVVTNEDLLQGGDAGDEGFAAGQTFALGNLVRFGLIASSNDAMQAAAGSLGPDYIDDINAAAAELGLTKMHFINPTGLDESTTLAGAYGSAYDVARLAAIFYQKYPQYFENTTQATGTLAVEDGTLAATATAAPLDSIPGFVAAKTGYTDLAGGNLVAVFDIDIGHPLVVVALGSTEDGRFSDIKTLISAARASQP